MLNFASDTLRIASALVSRGAESGDTMRASWMPGRKDDLLAVDSEGSLVLLIRQYGPQNKKVIQWNHRALAVLPCGEYHVRVDEAEFSDRYRAIILKPGNEHLLSAFSILSATLLSYLSITPTCSDIDNFMTELIELFNVEPEVSIENVIGLWGELSVISMAKDSHVWFDAWHALPNSLYDFTFGTCNVEVKTAMSVRPVHHFSHSQLAREPQKSYIASVLVREDRGGRSIADLVEDISVGLPLASQAALEGRVLRAFGREVEILQDLRLTAMDDGSPRFLRADYIPRVAVSPGAPISDISYRVDLSVPLANHGSLTVPVTLV